MLRCELERILVLRAPPPQCVVWSASKHAGSGVTWWHAARSNCVLVFGCALHCRQLAAVSIQGSLVCVLASVPALVTTDMLAIVQMYRSMGPYLWPQSGCVRARDLLICLNPASSCAVVGCQKTVRGLGMVPRARLSLVALCT
jgi:hypothetical protein